MKPILSHHCVRLILVAIAVSLSLGGCASSGAIQMGDEAFLTGDWDTAVEHFRQAVQDDPDDTLARISLERAMQKSARIHETFARDLESQGQLPAALSEYRQASRHDPTNGRLRATVTALERRIREAIEAAQPPSRIERLQQHVRQPLPLLDPSSTEPMTFAFRNASLRDIFDFMGNAAGINVTFDQQFQDRSYTVKLDGVTLQEALNQILTANQLFYKVVNTRSLIIVPDTPQKRSQYEEQVIRTFYVSHADVTELATLLTQIVRAPTLAVQPQIVPNSASNAITVRATTAVAAVIEKVISANDKPRAEIVVDVAILEVNRERAKKFGLDLNQYAIGAMFSPSGTAGANSSFSADRLSNRVSAANFYLGVPSAVIDFLETDSETRLVAKPQLRGQEGSQLILNLGDDIPVPSTSFTPIATGGVAVNPLTSYEYRSVGVNVTMTPRVTFNDEIILDLEVENSTLGPNINVAGQALPTFGTRRVITRLRLRDGESNLLAGLLREEDRRSLRGLPGIRRLPIIGKLLSSNDNAIKQTDIVMLLTPHIVRTHELTPEDVSPIYIGTAQNMGISGPLPLIAPVASPTDGPPPTNDSQGVNLRAPALPPLSGDLLDSAPVEPHPTFLVGTSRPSYGAHVNVVSPDTDLLMNTGPYTVPISISGASQVSTLSLSLTFDPKVLRVQAVKEGSFMRQGEANVTFAQNVDATNGRIDLALTRTGDLSGAAGSGLVAAIVFEAVAKGSATLSPSGLGLSPGGAPLVLNFRPSTVSVR